MTESFMGFSKPIHAIVVGGRNGVGAEFVQRIAQAHPDNRVYATSRDAAWVRTPITQSNIERVRLDLTDESSVQDFAGQLEIDERPIHLVLNCSGLLHGEGLSPERTWRHLDPDFIRRVFDVNLVAVGMAIKHFIPLMPRKERAVFGSLSARVGSIGDNRLGGWYSYRASKAAQNMFIKCAAIEAARTRKDMICVALHPGTVDTDLSKPFTARTPAAKLFSTEQCVGYLTDVIGDLTPHDTGGFFAWDGSNIEY